MSMLIKSRHWQCSYLSMASNLNLIPAGITPFFEQKFLLKTKKSQGLYLRVCCKQRRSWNIRNLFIVWLDNPVGTPKSVARAQRGDLHSTKQLLKHKVRDINLREPQKKSGQVVLSSVTGISKAVLLLKAFVKLLCWELHLLVLPTHV